MLPQAWMMMRNGESDEPWQSHYFVTTLHTHPPTPTPTHPNPSLMRTLSLWQKGLYSLKGPKCSSFLLCLPYSREQKHALISDTPMLLIEINSISNMGVKK